LALDKTTINDWQLGRDMAGSSWKLI
jgi:hypothetical protein